jgi:hypothetical protein
MSAGNTLGALCTLIGWGCNTVLGPPTPTNPLNGATPLVAHIGITPVSDLAKDPTNTAKALVIRINSSGAAIAADAAMPGGTELNRTGQSVPIGGLVLAAAP